MFRTVSVLLAAIGLMPLPAQSATNAEQAVEAFYRLCLAAGPSFNRMIVFAGNHYWAPVAQAAFAEMLPVAGPSAVEAWLADEEEEGLPAGTIIGVTKAKLRDKPVQTCTVAFPDLDQELFRKSFFTRTDAEKIAEDRDSEKFSRLYVVVAGGQKQFVRLVMLPSNWPGLPVVVASSIMGN